MSYVCVEGWSTVHESKGHRNGGWGAGLSREDLRKKISRRKFWEDLWK